MKKKIFLFLSFLAFSNFLYCSDAHDIKDSSDAHDIKDSGGVCDIKAGDRVSYRDMKNCLVVRVYDCIGTTFVKFKTGFGISWDLRFDRVEKCEQRCEKEE